MIQGNRGKGQRIPIHCPMPGTQNDLRWDKMIKTDVIIIGAGLLGCFTARNLMRYPLEAVVLEQEADVCRGISKANTGIIYPGYDQKPGSEKGKLCVQANEAFDRLCQELDVPFARPGSLMIAYGPRADRQIQKKYRDGLEGGVKGLRLLSGAEAEEMEPALARGITSALYARDTGTINPWELCIAAYENARANGAEFRFGSRVTEIRRAAGGFRVETAQNESFEAPVVINAAGLSSDKVRELVERPRLRLYPTAADYIVLDKTAKGTVEHIIFHEGEDGKGLTLVPTVDGNLLVGPTTREPSEEELEARDMRVETEGLTALKTLCDAVIPGLDLALQIRTFGSMRPNPWPVTEQDGRIIREEKSLKDFKLLEEDGLFSLIGIKTPGLTFSNELGKLVAGKAAARLGRTELRRDFDPARKGIVRARDLPEEDWASLIAADPAYGDVVCACMNVTRAEILAAIARGASDYEGVRRRTGIGMGHCQGSRCRRRVLDCLKEGLGGKTQ